MTINERMFKLIKEKACKKADLARLLNINTSVIATWEKRGTNPPAEYLARICDFLDISIYELLGIDSKDLTTDEQELLDLYRAADTDGKNTIYKVAEALGAGKVKDGESGIPEAM